MILRMNQNPDQYRAASDLTKNNTELSLSSGQALGEKEEKAEYTRLLKELADLT